MAQVELDGQDRKIYLDTTSPAGTKQQLENIATAVGLDLNHLDNRTWLDRIAAMGITTTTFNRLKQLLDRKTTDRT